MSKLTLLIFVIIGVFCAFGISYLSQIRKTTETKTATCGGIISQWVLPDAAVKVTSEGYPIVFKYSTNLMRDEQCDTTIPQRAFDGKHYLLNSIVWLACVAVFEVTGVALFRRARV